MNVDSFSNNCWSQQKQQQRRYTTTTRIVSSRIITSSSISNNNSNDDTINARKMKFKNHNQYSKTRRKILQQITTSATIASTTILAPPFLSPSNNNNEALAAQTAGEAIRKSAANIPGYGQPDVYYPPSFLGKWRATRVILAAAAAVSGGDEKQKQSDPLLSLVLSTADSLPITLYYDVRFITVDGDDGVTVNSNNNNGNGNSNPETQKVIADRQFNEAAYYNALRAEIIKQTQTTSTSMQLQPPPSIQSITWSPFNPNVCTSIYTDGSTQEIKVTKRAAELDIGNAIEERMTLISSSEYRRVTTTKGAMGIPSIAASRVLTKWKSEGMGVGVQSQSKNQIVEGIEIVYSDGMMGVGGGGEKPMLSSKSRLKLERL